MTRRLRLLPALVLLLGGVGGLVSGCGDDQSQVGAEDGPRSARETPPSIEPDELELQERPTPDPNRTLEPLPSPWRLTRPVRSHLLTTDRLPRVAEDSPWTGATDTTGAGDPVGICQKTSLIDIGALHSLQRSFESADGTTTATQVVARFPDRTSTWRAHQVLLSWRADCADRLGQDRARVGEVRGVPVRTGFGEAYPAAYGPKAADRRRATGLGIVRKGSWLSLVEVATTADRWPTGFDPTRQAVRRIARTFRS